eukprot:CAMPEP_0171279238 /NCGR_PEP_ID=MMETSP0790-20130122/65279_1 /TAXON_ID=2925 /ORGANISM="Alexandrium catenella, Strain OF101" /LENGTH=34 /DNA_ID= /DNA_START= /DNA_END= /DNA_ORIENTATION=
MELYLPGVAMELYLPGVGLGKQQSTAYRALRAQN